MLNIFTNKNKPEIKRFLRHFWAKIPHRLTCTLTHMLIVNNLFNFVNNL
jgi:hypothetical protein